MKHKVSGFEKNLGNDACLISGGGFVIWSMSYPAKPSSFRLHGLCGNRGLQIFDSSGSHTWVGGGANPLILHLSIDRSHCKNLVVAI